MGGGAFRAPGGIKVINNLLLRLRKAVKSWLCGSFSHVK